MSSSTKLSELCSRVRAFIRAPESDHIFERLALEIFQFQFENNLPYRAFCKAGNKTRENTNSWRDIPAILTSAFKDLELTVLPSGERTTVFHSSGTTQQRPSRHFHSTETISLYEDSLLAWFKPHVLPDKSRTPFLILSPLPGTAPHSSLVHMFETVSNQFGVSRQFVGQLSTDGGWLLDFQRIAGTLNTFSTPITICGTAFSFVHWCDHMSETSSRVSLPSGSRVFETGGYKGRSRTVPKHELHRLIEERLGIPQTHIISEYGMSELSSQAYDRVLGSPAPRIFQFPHWARSLIVSPETLREVPDGETGLVRIYDLANVGSVMAIQTEDLAIRRGAGFELIGRAALAEPRGCSLMEMRSLSSHHQHRTRTLWLSGILHGFTHLYQVALLPLYYLILQDKAFALNTVEQATFLVTVLMLSYFIPAYPVGVLADKFSKRKLLALGLAINALGFLGLAFSQSYAQAIGSMILSGFGGSFFHPAATALIARLFPEATGKALGFFGIGASAGFFFGPIYSGWRGAHSGWRAPVLELAIFGLVISFIFFLLADEEPAYERGTQPHEQTDRLFPSNVLLLIFIVAAFAFSLRDFTGSSMGSLGSLFLQNAHGLKPDATGGYLSMIFIASAISNPLFGRLSDRGLGRWTSFALGTAGLIVAVFPHVPVSIAGVVFALYGFFFMASYPMVEGALMSSVPHHVRGRVFGVFITIGGIVGNLAHWAMGAYVKQLGPNSSHPESYYLIYVALGTLIGLSLLGLPCLKALRRREAAAGELSPNFLPQKS